MSRFIDNVWTGIVAGLMVVGVVSFLFWWGFQIGHQRGWEQAIHDQEQVGAGRWIQMTLDGKRIEGWLR
jgi:hypothetical protein